MTGEDWKTANQRVLVAEFARLKAQLAGDEIGAIERDLRSARKTLTKPAAIDVLVDAFGLSDFERDVLLLTAGVVMQCELAVQCSEMPEGVNEPFATFGLALARLKDPHWSALTPVGPLRRGRLLRVRDNLELTRSPLTLDERILHYLAGINYPDPHLSKILRKTRPTAPLGATQEEASNTATRAIATSSAANFAIQLIGEDVLASIEVARRAAERWQKELHTVKASDIPINLHEVEELSLLWARDSRLLDSMLLVEVTDADVARATNFLDRMTGVCFSASPRALSLTQPDLRIEIGKLQHNDQKKLWIGSLGVAHRLNGALDSIVSQFRLDASAIQQIAQSIDVELPPGKLSQALWDGCRASARQRLDDVAQRVETLATWHDLVLPDAQMSTLRQITSHVHQRLKVYQSWGFCARSSRGLGITVLFAGESGTGKTMAAEVLANELRLDLYRIDLASMVSKYIGETEKNLKRVFEAADDSGAILLFDEADALFGKRSEVKDSHDRYANMEVSYLLQRMEAYRGLAILTTNIKGAIDPAFERRLRFCVKFPFPDAEHRELIWRKVFPQQAPLQNVDFSRLAKLNVAGGSIQNIAMSAAFIAAESSKSIGMAELLAATRSEAAKRERPFSDAETRGWM